VISYGQPTIVRGNFQTIYVSVTQNGEPMTELSVAFSVVYASGLTKNLPAASTNSSGVASATWKIGPNAQPGTFDVTVTVNGTSYASSFQVVTDSTTTTASSTQTNS